MDVKESKGTITPRENFDPEWLAEKFRKALRSFGTDERALVQLITIHSTEQRIEGGEKYKELFGSDLREDLKSELGGNFEETIVGLMMTSEEFLVTSLHDSLYAPGTDEKTIIEILCNRSPKEIQSFNLLYEKKYAETLEESLSSNLSGDFQLLMTSLVSEGRDQSQRVDPITARKEAQDLYDAGISNISGSDEIEFTKILNTRSYPQLQETFKEYERISMEPIEKSISSEFSGDLKQGLLAISIMKIIVLFSLYKSEKNIQSGPRNSSHLLATGSGRTPSFCRNRHRRMNRKTKIKRTLHTDRQSSNREKRATSSSKKLKAGYIFVTPPIKRQILLSVQIMDYSLFQLTAY